MWKKRLIKNKRYLTFHDFTAYLDDSFGTRCVGVISPSFHHGGLSPKHLKKLATTVRRKNVTVFLKEAQFSDAGIKKLMPPHHGTIVTVDYLGSDKPLSKNLFEEILESILKEFL